MEPLSQPPDLALLLPMDTHHQLVNTLTNAGISSLSAPRGGEGRGEVGADAILTADHHSTLAAPRCLPVGYTRSRPVSAGFRRSRRSWLSVYPVPEQRGDRSYRQCPAGCISGTGCIPHLTLTLSAPEGGEGNAWASPRVCGTCSYAGANMGIGGPPSLGTNFNFTFWPIFSASKSQSTMLVIIDGPSSSVTYAIANGTSARAITLNE
jgi:hypothetical protein